MPPEKVRTRSPALSSSPMAARIRPTRRLQFRAANAVEFAEKAQVFAGRQFAVESQFLRHDADETAHLAVAGHEGPAQQTHLAARRLKQTRHDR